MYSLRYQKIITTFICSMNKREFLKQTSLISAASLFSFGNIAAGSKRNLWDPNSCTLIPTETAGPFPLDLTENTSFLRSDIRETKTGVRLNLKLKIIGADNCLAMQNVRVNVWHCDKDGLYSGYSQTNNPGQSGLTYLRGYQFTDSNGEVNFITILPGWYTGRICHIHFQIYVSTTYAAISQLTFDVATKNAIYAANPSLYTKGADPMSISSDNIFSDGATLQTATLTANSTTGGYDSYLQVAVQRTVSSIGNLERQTAQQFILRQNFPNPYTATTTVPFTLKKFADIVSLDLWDINGKKIKSLTRRHLTAGDYNFELNMPSLGISAGNYVYQLEVQNGDGLFRDCKMMTSVS